MAKPSSDLRSVERKGRDEQIASEPLLPPPDLPADAKPSPVEDHLRRAARRPHAFVGIVENGVIRLLDTDVQLPERSRVIIVVPG